MASSKQTQRILTQGKHIIQSQSKKRLRTISNENINAQDNDDNQEETLQQTNVCLSG